MTERSTGTDPAGAAAPRLVPPWLDRLASVGWRALAAILLGLVLVAIAVELSSATAATLVAFVLAAALAPTVRRLRAGGLSRTAAAGITCVAGGAAIVAVALAVVFSLGQDAVAIVGAVRRGVAELRLEFVELGLPELALRTYDRIAESLLGLFSVDVGSLAGTAISVGTVLVLGTFLTFFLLQDGDRGWSSLMRPLESWRAEVVTTSAAQAFDKVGWYIRRTVLLAVMDALVVWAVLAAFGISLAPALAAVAFIAGLVPYLGAIAGAGVIALAALALGGPAPAVAVLVALSAATIVVGRILEATPFGRRTDVHPVLVLFALPAGAALFGLLGLIVSLPVTVFAAGMGKALVRALDVAPEAIAGSPARTAQGVPVWLDRIAQWSWRGLVVAALGWVTIQVIVRIPGVVVPALIAVVAAATLLPLVDRLDARGWPRGPASATATVGAAAAIAVTVLLALALTVAPLREIVDVAVTGASLADLEWLAGAIEELGAAATIDVGGLLASAFALGLSLVLALLLTFFFLRDGRWAWKRTLARMSPARRVPVAEAGRRAVDVLAGYMIGTAIISAFGALTSGLIMVILGLPLGLPIAVLTFFASFIPYIGSAITTALAFLVAVALGTTTDIVIMAGYTVVFNIVQGNFVTPLVYGRSLRLHPAVVLMAIPVGGEIAGILGMFLIVPITAIVAATWRLVLQAIDADEEPAASASATDAPPNAEPPAPSELPAPSASASATTASSRASPTAEGGQS